MQRRVRGKIYKRDFQHVVVAVATALCTVCFLMFSIPVPFCMWCFPSQLCICCIFSPTGVIPGASIGSARVSYCPCFLCVFLCWGVRIGVKGMEVNVCMQVECMIKQTMGATKHSVKSTPDIHT